MYTSFTGFFDKDYSGAGTVQLLAMARLLQEAGFAFWDLGQELAYKLDLGCGASPPPHTAPRACSSRLMDCMDRRRAKLLPRAEFLAEFRAARDASAVSAEPLHTLPRATAPTAALT